MPTQFTENTSSFDKASLLIKKVNARLNKDLATVDTVFQKISLVDTEAKAAIQVYPIHVASAAEVKMGPDEPMVFSQGIIQKVYCETAVYANKTAELLPMLESQDPYGLLTKYATEWPKQMSKVPDRRLAAMMNTNDVSSIDNVQFFSSSHIVNPNVKSALATETYSNDITVKGTPEDWIISAIDQMVSIKGFDGTKINDGVLKYTILVPTIALKVRLNKILHDGLIAEQVGSAAAGTNTQMAGYGETLFMPELFDATNPLTAKRFYVIATDLINSRPPLITRISKAPQLYMTSGSADDVYFRDHNSRAVFYRLEMGTAFGLPQKICRVTVDA